MAFLQILPEFHFLCDFLSQLHNYSQHKVAMLTRPCNHQLSVEKSVKSRNYSLFLKKLSWFVWHHEDCIDGVIFAFFCPGHFLTIQHGARFVCLIETDHCAVQCGFAHCRALNCRSVCRFRFQNSCNQFKIDLRKKSNCPESTIIHHLFGYFYVIVICQFSSVDCQN